MSHFHDGKELTGNGAEWTDGIKKVYKVRLIGID